MYSIMIVDDREIFRRQLKRFQAFCDSTAFSIKYEAQNGEEALALLRENKIDMVITDIRMPIMDGIELLQHIKEENLCGCVVFLSEYAEFSYARQGLQMGAFDYLVKPVSNEAVRVLLDRAESLLSTSRDSWLDITDAQKERIAQFMMDNDEYARKLCGEIAEGLVAGSTGDAVAVEALTGLLHDVGELILAKRDYLRELIDTESLFSLPPCQHNEICSRFDEKIAEVMKKVNSFRLNVRNELIQSVSDSILRSLGRDISLQSMADLHFVNKAYLSHLFSQETGISFMDYVNSIRMECAKHRIACTNDKIYEIAADLKYSDTEYFSKVFKQYTGYTPSAYRALTRPEDGDE